MIQIILVLVVVGVVVYLLNTLVPMDPRFKTVINAVIGLCLFVWILSVFGVIAPVNLNGPIYRR